MHSNTHARTRQGLALLGRIALGWRRCPCRPCPCRCPCCPCGRLLQQTVEEVCEHVVVEGRAGLCGPILAGRAVCCGLGSRHRGLPCRRGACGAACCGSGSSRGRRRHGTRGWLGQGRRFFGIRGKDCCLLAQKVLLVLGDDVSRGANFDRLRANDVHVKGVVGADGLQAGVQHRNLLFVVPAAWNKDGVAIGDVCLCREREAKGAVGNVSAEQVACARILVGVQQRCTVAQACLAQVHLDKFKVLVAVVKVSLERVCHVALVGDNDHGQAKVEGEDTGLERQCNLLSVVCWCRAGLRVCLVVGYDFCSQLIKIRSFKRLHVCVENLEPLVQRLESCPWPRHVQNNHHQKRLEILLGHDKGQQRFVIRRVVKCVYTQPRDHLLAAVFVFYVNIRVFQPCSLCVLFIGMFPTL
eukprot:m.30857 g.30857  ORF g.30857 m.30857 type:complete len:412 (+) comp9274_c0_seq2:269-1504(+)